VTSAGTIAFLVSLFALWFLFQQQATCARCNGKGRHRRDCPFADRDDPH
jgi:DnaJ-class molecular chaperone